MSKLTFAYVTYIATTPEKLWEALTEPDITEKFWFGYRISSAWTVGARYTARAPGGKVLEHGIVLACDLSRRVTYTWSPQYDIAQGERPSRVSFDLLPFKGQVQLTVVADDFDEGSKIYEIICDGWPKVLSSLKSYLETGTGLEPTWSMADDRRHASAEARA